MAFQYKVEDGKHWCTCKICKYLTPKTDNIDSAMKNYGHHLLINHPEEKGTIKDIADMFGPIYL